MNVEKCEFKDCTRPRDHSGPHGIDAGQGLIMAPWGGDDGVVSGPNPSKIACDSCSAPMTVYSFSEGGGMLACTVCGQDHTYHKDGSHYQKSLTLFPSQMENGSEMHRKFVAHKHSQWRFNADARLALGMISDNEWKRDTAQADAVVLKWQREHPAIAPKVGFLSRLRSFIGI